MGELLEPRHKTLRGMGPWAPVPGWLIRHHGLTDRALRLYNVLALMTNASTSMAFPSRLTIANTMGCSVKTVDRALRELLSISGVEVIHRYRPGTHEWTSSEYRVCIDNPCSEVGTDLTPGRDIDDATVGTDLTPGGVTDDAAEQEVLNQNQVNKNHLTRPERIELVWDAYCKAFVPEGKSPKYLLAVRDRLVRDHGHYVIEVLDAYRPTQIADRIRAREQQAMAQ